MDGDSKIQWTQKTWNPVAGCSVLSPGCTNCYAMKMAARIEAMARGAGRTSAYDGLTRQTKAGPVWSVGKRAAGRLLDGLEHNAMPSAGPYPFGLGNG